jgi:tripartite motif-containing protein 71
VTDRGGYYTYISSGGTIVTGTSIHEFDAKGNFIRSWGSFGTGTGQLYLGMGIAADKYGNIYVPDFVGRRVEKFDSTGGNIGQWGGVGAGNGGFSWPFDVAVDSQGRVFVSDVYNQLVQEFKPTP